MFSVLSEHRSHSQGATVLSLSHVRPRLSKRLDGNGDSIAEVLPPTEVHGVDACEMQHRMKNIISVVQSLCRQTMKHSSTKEDFDKQFSARLMSYLNSVNMLIANNWGGFQIQDLIRSQLATFVRLDGGQIVIDGPPLRISEQGAHSLGLALHELATNAIKYGSLSVPEGRVAITWSVIGADEGLRFDLRWVESGGPVVAPPACWGFGHQIIQDLSARALSGQASYEFLPEGVRWSLDAPARSVVVD